MQTFSLRQNSLKFFECKLFIIVSLISFSRIFLPPLVSNLTFFGTIWEVLVEAITVNNTITHCGIETILTSKLDTFLTLEIEDSFETLLLIIKKFKRNLVRINQIYTLVQFTTFSCNFLYSIVIVITNGEPGIRAVVIILTMFLIVQVPDIHREKVRKQ